MKNVLVKIRRWNLENVLGGLVEDRHNIPVACSSWMLVFVFVLPRHCWFIICTTLRLMILKLLSVKQQRATRATGIKTSVHVMRMVSILSIWSTLMVFFFFSFLSVWWGSWIGLCSQFLVVESRGSKIIIKGTSQTLFQSALCRFPFLVRMTWSYNRRRVSCNFSMVGVMPYRSRMSQLWELWFWPNGTSSSCTCQYMVRQLLF